MALSIQPVASRSELVRFIRLAATINRDDPNWVTPLTSERLAALTPGKNPFFEHADVQLWLAVRDGRDVGRISAQIDALAPADPNRKVGHFGLIVAHDDPEVFALLLRTAEAWLKDRDCDTAMGPFNLSVNEEIGLLVDGFDTPPMVMMGHDPAYAGARVEEQGYVKAKDVYAYLAQITDDIPAAARRRVSRGMAPGVNVRMLDMSRYAEEIVTMTEILNDAWKDNWGFTPTTEAETRQLGEALKPVIDKRLIFFAEVDGEAAGVVVLLPDINEAIRGLDGRLFPFGWARLLWRLKVARVKSLRVPLMGVRRKFGESARGRMLPFHLMDASSAQARKLGYKQYEFSWILEDNMPMRRISEACGAHIYKTYRIYEKALA